MIAREAAVPASSVPLRAGAIASTPALMRSIGSCLPITPVEASSTASAGIPSCLTAASAVSSQNFIPSAPVQAFAMPALMTTACAQAEFRTMFRSHKTGAALTTLDVNVPAQIHGTVLYTIAISALSLYLIPAAVLAA